MPTVIASGKPEWHYCQGVLLITIYIHNNKVIPLILFFFSVKYFNKESKTYLKKKIFLFFMCGECVCVGGGGGGGEREGGLEHRSLKF